MTQESTSAPLGVPEQMYFFKIYANGDESGPPRDVPLFGNGRQQLHVTVKMAALDGSGNWVSLTYNELKTINLIKYTDSTNIPYSDTPFLFPWSYTELKGPWEYDLSVLNAVAVMENEQPELFTAAQPFVCLPDRGEVQAISPPCLNCETVPFTEEEKALLSAANPGMVFSDYTSVHFYVSTTSREPMKIAASIRLYNNVIVRTNWEDAPDGNGLGDGRGKFNSSINVVPKQFPNVPDSAYGERYTDGSNPDLLRATFVSQGDSNEQDRLFEHTVNIKLNGRIINIASVNCPTLFGDGGTGRNGGTSHTYYTGPNNKRIYCYPPGYLGVGSGFWSSDFLMWERLYPNREARNHSIGQITIGHVLTGWNIWFYTRPYERAPAAVTEGPLTLIDVYGNEHRLKLAFLRPTYYNDLTLKKV